jgi:hypothetical protein
VDDGTLFPSPGLELIRAAVLAHHIQVENRKFEEKLLADPIGSTAAPKNWTVTIYTSKGEVATRVNDHGKVVDLEDGFALAQDAAGWCDRRLVNDCPPDCFGVIVHNASSHEEVIMRDDAMARVFRKKGGPMTKRQSKGDGKLSFGVKVKQSHASFSRG